MDARLLGSGGLVPLCLLLLLSVTSTRGYSGGAGEPACSTLMPGHGVQSKDIMTSPYQVELSQTSYEPGETIKGERSVGLPRDRWKQGKVFKCIKNRQFPYFTHGKYQF